MPKSHPRFETEEQTLQRLWLEISRARANADFAEVDRLQAIFEKNEAALKALKKGKRS